MIAINAGIAARNIPQALRSMN